MTRDPAAKGKLNVIKFLLIFAAAIPLCVMTVIAFNYGAKIVSLKKNIAALQDRLARGKNYSAPERSTESPSFEEMERRLAALKEIAFVNNSGSATDFSGSVTARAALLRDMLLKQGLRPANYRIIGAESGEAAVEFTLKGAARPFLDFLAETERRSIAAVQYLAVRTLPNPEGGIGRELEISLRLGAPESAAANIPAGSGAEMAGLFRHSGKPRVEESATVSTAAILSVEENDGNAVDDSGSLIYLGLIRDDGGIEFAYYKEKNSGLIVKKLRP